MSRLRSSPVLLACLLGGCAATSVQQPVEILDERTGVTIAALQRPLELTQRDIAVGRRPGFAYIGPVEWNRMGSYTQGLWVHLAPGQDRPLADIHAAATLRLTLDDGVLELPATAQLPGRDPYQPAVPWGQTAYFRLTVPELRRLAASAHLDLRCAAADGDSVAFTTSGDPRPLLQAYLKSRNFTGD